MAARLLDHRTVGAEVAAQYRRGEPRRHERIVEGPDHTAVDGLLGMLADRAPGDRDGVGVQQRTQLVQHCRDPAGVAEVFHQQLAGGLQVDEHRHVGGELVDVGELERNSGAPGDGDEVDDGVGRSADRGKDAYGVLEGLEGENVRQPHVLAHELDHPPARPLGEGVTARVDGGEGGSAGQLYAERLGEAGHRRGRAHRHAVPEAAHGAGLEVEEVLAGDRPGTRLLALAPQIGSRAELLGAAVGAQLWAAGEHDRRQVDAGGAHQLRRRGLVAPGEQHHTVERVGTQHFLDVHRHEVAQEHRRRPQHLLAERDRRELEGESARLPHAPLDRFGEAAQVGVARGELGPALGDADHRPPVGDIPRQSLHQQTGAVDDAVAVTLAEPRAAAQVLAHDSSLRVIAGGGSPSGGVSPICCRGVRAVRPAVAFISARPGPPPPRRRAPRLAGRGLHPAAARCPSPESRPDPAGGQPDG